MKLHLQLRPRRWHVLQGIVLHGIDFQGTVRRCVSLLLTAQLVVACSFSATAQQDPSGQSLNDQTLPEDVHQVVEFYEVPSTAQAPASLANLPADWRQEFVTEPVWNSRLFLLQAGIANEPSIVLIHGLSERGVGDWLDVIPDLAREYHVIAFDLPGFGRSAKPAGRYSPDNYAKIVAWLVQQYAHGPVRAAGYSMGGAVTLQYAAHYPQQIERVILVSAAGVLERRALMEGAVELPVDTRWLPGPLKKLGNKVGQLGRRFVEWTSVVPDPTPVIDDYDEIWVTLFGDYPFANAAYALSLHDFTEAIRLLQKDTYLIWGSEDSVAPLRSGKILRDKIARAELAIVDGAGHTLITTHTRVFETKLLEALQSSGITQNEISIPLPFRGTLECQNQHGLTYSGRYDEIILRGCTDILLIDVSTERLLISNSQAELENVTVVSEEADAVIIDNSFVKATNSTFSGPTAVFANASRLDFANVTVESPKYAMRFEKKSRVVFSLSQIASKVFNGPVHELYTGQYVWVDDQL